MFFREFPLPKEPAIPGYSVSIEEFDAKEMKDCTGSIQKAIAHVAGKGGGHVRIPAGKWCTGAVHLQSNIDLHFEEGAVLNFSTDPKDYLPVVPVVLEGIRCSNYSPFLYGNNLENISVTGRGILEGNGQAWWPWKQNRKGMLDLYHAGSELRPLEKRVYGTPEEGLRSPFIQFLNCKNVLLEDFTLHNSPFWNVDPVWCENIIIRGITIDSPYDSHNTDGINMDSCRNGLVENCTVINAGDDLFCLKAGRNEDGRAVGIPCENIIIRHCKSLGRCQSGGIVIGSEMSAGVHNILAYDCEFADNINGIRIKSKDGRGGVVENIECRNIHLKKGMRGINLSYRYEYENPADEPKKKGAHMPVFKNIYFENVTCDKVNTGISIDGIPGGCMKNIYMKNIVMNATQCMVADSVDGLNMENVRLNQIDG